MENVLEIFFPIFYVSRLVGLAPFNFTKNQICPSSKWLYYSYIFTFLNLLLQILKQKAFIIHFNAEEKLKNFVWIFGSITLPFNSIANSIIILQNSEVFKDIKLLNQILQENRKEVKWKDIKEIKLISYVVFNICIILAIVAPLTQHMCSSSTKYFTLEETLIQSLSWVTRTFTTIALLGQFITYSLAVRFAYKILNSAIYSIKITISKRNARVPNANRYWSLIIRGLMINDYKLKDLIEKVNNIFGLFNMFIALNVFVEFNYVIVFENIYLKDDECQRFLSYYWTFHSGVVLFGCLAAPVLLKRTVSECSA